MVKISDVIARLEYIKSVTGDVEVKIVNYHSDFEDAEIEDITKSVTVDIDPTGHSVSEWTYWVVIGGERY